MELKEFVSVTLDQIIAGVKASMANKENDDLICPSLNIMGGVNKGSLIAEKNGKPVQMVSFDVAVTTVESTEKKEGVGVMVLGAIGLASQGKETSQGANASRIKFEVPIVFP